MIGAIIFSISPLKTFLKTALAYHTADNSVQKFPDQQHGVSLLALSMSWSSAYRLNFVFAKREFFQRQTLQLTCFGRAQGPL
mgnify:CR=1 FL=1